MSLLHVYSVVSSHTKVTRKSFFAVASDMYLWFKQKHREKERKVLKRKTNERAHANYPMRSTLLDANAGEQ